MLFKKEKKVIRLINRYLKEVGKCLDIAQEAIRHYINGEIDKAKPLAKQTRLAESGVDDLRHEIRDQLYSGAYMPLLREDIYRLVESIDKVANASEAACDFFLNQRPRIPKEMHDDFLTIAQTSLSIFIPLKEAISVFINGEKANGLLREHTKAVCTQESEVDRRYDQRRVLFILYPPTYCQGG